MEEYSVRANTAQSRNLEQRPRICRNGLCSVSQVHVCIREDGSNIGDARRGCLAANYNIWASQFMSDFLYQSGSDFSSVME